MSKEKAVAEPNKEKNSKSIWNVSIMLHKEKMQEIVKDIKRYRIDINAIQEMWWKGQGKINKYNLKLKYSGVEKQG